MASGLLAVLGQCSAELEDGCFSGHGWLRWMASGVLVADTCGHVAQRCHEKGSTDVLLPPLLIIDGRLYYLLSCCRRSIHGRGHTITCLRTSRTSWQA